jgi:hypothetical protein
MTVRPKGYSTLPFSPNGGYTESIIHSQIAAFLHRYTLRFLTDACKLRAMKIDSSYAANEYTWGALTKMKMTRRDAFSLIILTLLFALTVPALAAESEKPDERATVPIGLNRVPSQERATDQAIAEEFQLDFFTTIFQWKEPRRGEYFWEEFADEDPFKKHLQSLKQQGYVVSLTNTTVHMDQKHLPEYLDGKSFDDPVLLMRWEAFLRAFLAEYGDSIDFLNLSNEVGSYFGGHREEWPAYLTFVRKGAEVVHEVRPEIRVGVALSCNSAASYWPDIEPYCDYLAFNYYTPNSSLGKSPTAEALDPDNPNYFVVALEGMLRLAGTKPVLIQEIGCATHESIDSSPELQAQFIEQLVAWLPGKEDRILGISWLSHTDWPYAHTKQALQGFLDEELLEHEPFMRYLTSLGLMYEDGVKKPGYDTMKNSLASYRRGELQSMPLVQPRLHTLRLSNGGFETGDLSEAANNVMGPKSWLTSNSGGNAIAVTEQGARTGSHCLQWQPIGWNVKDDQTIEDACTFIITRISPQTDSRAISVRLSGGVNTSTLDPKFQVSVILANSTFTKVKFDTVLRGGVEGWQTFDTSLELGAEGDTLFLAFMVIGSKGVGAGEGSVYLDDLELTSVPLP